ncbi:protein kinase, putative [Plasmodium relictum]|uniref:Protein kinase, putative n=1 Tax=Plasmodium relictum TaxID=85471 RepID=A0A1J1HAA0_PLARL|nr:protein kinase, putative [Plasmodium relictum]CRH01550.1 protein kinase, putative [Plasmodium relictum]
MHFLNNSFEKNNFKLEFRKQLEEKINVYIKSGIIANELLSEEKKHIFKNIQIKINKELIKNYNEKFLLDILNINSSKLKLCYEVKYNIIHSILLKKKYIKNNINKDEKAINNIYKIKKKNISYFVNEFLIIKCIHSGEYGNIYYCKNVLENKKCCMKIFYLELCLKKNCPYYINNEVYLTNYFHKILNEIFFLNYLNHNNIIKIKNIFFDEKKKILFIVFPYVKYQSMHYKKKYGVYSIYNKVTKVDKYIKIFLYSEKFIRSLFLNIYNTLTYLLEKNVAYLDLKPDNILLTTRLKNEIIPFSLKLKKKKKKRNIKDNSLEKNIELPKLELNIYKKLNKNQNKYDKKSFYNNKIFSRKKKEKKRKNYFCFFKKLSLKKLKNKNIKYIYNINLPTCFAYDKNVKRIFFKENKLDDIFFSSNDSNVFIQMFIQKRENYNILNLSKDSKYKKNKGDIVKRIKKDKIRLNKYNINKIRNLSIFKYKKKKNMNFLKFYWLYFNEEKMFNDFLLYVDIYFINKYFCKKIIKKNNILVINKNQKQKINNEMNNQQTENILNNENSQRKISNYYNRREIHKEDKERKYNFSNDEINKINIMRLIDFDTCAFILKNNNSYTVGTNIFNSFECLFNFTNKNIQFSKKLSYNFGSVLYAFLFGRTPYYGDDIFEIYNNMKKNKLVFPKYRKINKILKNLLRKLLNNNPDNRIQFRIIKQHKWFTNIE